MQTCFLQMMPCLSLILVESAAQSMARKGRMIGTMPAKKDTRPQKERSRRVEMIARSLRSCVVLSPNYLSFASGIGGFWGLHV